MAIDSFMTFIPYAGKGAAGTALDAESQVSFSNAASGDTLGSVFTAGKVFEVSEYEFDIEQTLNIGSQSGGAGAGKITFNPFSITRAIDKASPTLFQMACSGTAFANVYLGLRKSVGTGGGGSNATGAFFLRFDFKLVAVKTLSYSHDEVSPQEKVTFEYGALQMRYRPQDASGVLGPVNQVGWDRVRNISDVTDKVI